jgi:hypothetical protein
MARLRAFQGLVRKWWTGVLLVAAVLPGPAHAQASQPYALAPGSTFQRGCFDPCACPIGQEQPLAGTFSLAPRFDYGTFAEYDVLDVHWQVQGNEYATPPNAVITGDGLYSLSSEFAVRQRMTADLSVADEPPASFDSGWVVGGTEFPDAIDIEISRNGRYCFDTVLHIVAKAQPLPEPSFPRGLAIAALALFASGRRVRPGPPRTERASPARGPR